MAFFEPITTLPNADEAADRSGRQVCTTPGLRKIYMEQIWPKVLEACAAKETFCHIDKVHWVDVHITWSHILDLCERLHYTNVSKGDTSTSLYLEWD